MRTKTPALGRVTHVLNGVSDVREGMLILSKLGMMPQRYGVNRYFLCDGEPKLSPSNISDLARWASVARRRILKIEDIAIEAMLLSKYDYAGRISETIYISDEPCVVWGFDLEGWVESRADEYGVRLVSVKPYEAILTI